MATWKTDEDEKVNIKMDLKKIGCEDGKWLKLSQDHIQWQDVEPLDCYHGVS
jgi:hypothetical protein